MRGKESMPSSRKGRQNSPANDSYRETDPDGKQPPPKRFRSGKNNNQTKHFPLTTSMRYPASRRLAPAMPRSNTDLRDSCDP